MANRPHRVTREPVDLKTVTELALEEGTSYVVHNAGTDIIRWAAVAEAPNPLTEDVSFPIAPGGFALMPVGDDPIWVWVTTGSGVTLRLNEA